MSKRLTKKDYPKEGTLFQNWIVVSSIPVKQKDGKNKFLVKCIVCGVTEKYEFLHQLKNGNSLMCKKCSIKNIKRNRRKPRMLTKDISFIIFNNIRRQANIRNIEFNISPNYLQDLLIFQNYKCKLSNLDISLSKTINGKKDREENTASLDRIDNNKGYIENNVQWVHKKVNYMKHILNNDEFINICKMISNNHVNFEPNVLNSKNNVDTKVQRLTVEDLDTNNTDTSTQ